MSVYFISDLHLKSERPDLTRAFSHLLDEISDDAEAIYLLGDIFEAWIGDDTPVESLQEPLLKLAAMSQAGCQLFFQHGNRDFLVGEQFAQSICAKLLPEALVIDLPIGPALIMHGDQLCLDDQEYMQFRSMVRNPQWQQAFLSKTLPERLTIAKQLRDESQARGAEKSAYITDVTAEAVVESLNHHQVDLMIHGHTHRPAIHTLEVNEKPATRIVLGDWDKLGWYLKIDQSGYDLISFEI